MYLLVGLPVPSGEKFSFFFVPPTPRGPGSGKGGVKMPRYLSTVRVINLGKTNAEIAEELGEERRVEGGGHIAKP